MSQNPNMKRVIAATMVGNGLEWYDYALYGHFAAIISKYFFPSHDASVALIATFGIFAAGFLMRPLGGVFFGFIGDKYGRKNALALSILLMAMPTACIGLLPTYAAIGIAAPILLTVIRLTQGMAIGGEFGGSIVYLVEHSKKDNKNLIGSAAIMSMLIGILVGSAISTILAQTLTPAQFDAWGWRLPFVLGFFIGVIGLYVRSKLSESPVFMDAKETGHISDKPVKETLQQNWKEVLLGMGVYLAVTIPFYIQTVFMNTFMQQYLKFTPRDALTINTINLVVMLVFVPIAAKICDRFNRERILKIDLVLYILYAIPLMHFMNNQHILTALVAQVIFSVIVAFYIAVIPALLVDLFPTKTRYTAMSLTCNVAAAAFGGTAPMVLTWLLKAHSNYSISYYIMTACTISLISIILAKRSLQANSLHGTHSNGGNDGSATDNGESAENNASSMQQAA